MRTLLQNEETYRAKYLLIDEFTADLLSDKAENSKGWAISYLEILLRHMKTENSYKTIKILRFKMLHKCKLSLHAKLVDIKSSVHQRLHGF